MKANEEIRILKTICNIAEAIAKPEMIPINLRRLDSEYVKDAYGLISYILMWAEQAEEMLETAISKEDFYSEEQEGLEPEEYKYWQNEPWATIGHLKSKMYSPNKDHKE